MLPTTISYKLYPGRLRRSGPSARVCRPEKVGDVEAPEDKRVTTEVRRCTNGVRFDENSHVQTDSLKRTLHDAVRHTKETIKRDDDAKHDTWGIF